MGYPTISNFDIEFIRRTLENLDSDVKNIYTHRINSFFSTIIIIRQWGIQNKRNPKFFNQLLSDFRELEFLNTVDFYSDEFNEKIECQKLESRNHKIDNFTFGHLFDSLRHSLAHQSFKPTKSFHEWDGVLFRNYRNEEETSKWENNFRTQIYLNMKEIKTIMLLAANLYFKEFEHK